jgi:hypothetical protein
VADTRTRLAEGGIPLADAFRSVMEKLSEVQSCATPALAEAVKPKLGFKEDRIRAWWGGWENLTTDVLEVLAENDYVSCTEPGRWADTGKAVPGKEVCIRLGSDVRVRFTFHNARRREMDEHVGAAQVMLNDLMTHLKNAPESYLALERAQLKLAIVAGLLAEALARGPVRKLKRRTGITGWYNQYSAATGWHTVEDAIHQWNREFPDEQLPLPSRAGGAPLRGAVGRLRLAGMLEQRPLRGGRNGTKQYRRTDL